jgi:hypothetical protein
MVCCFFEITHRFGIAIAIAVAIEKDYIYKTFFHCKNRL